MDTALIEECINAVENPLMASRALSRRERRLKFRDAKAEAWVLAKERYRAKHSRAVVAEYGGKVGFISIPTVLIWWSFFRALWPVFEKIWRRMRGDEDDVL